MIYKNPMRTPNAYCFALLPAGSPHHDEEGFSMWDVIYSTLAFTYGVTVQTEHNPKDFWKMRNTVHISLEMENSATIPLQELDHPERAVYVTGNSRMLAPAHVMDVKEIIRVHVPTPKKFRLVEPNNPEHSMYGFQVLPIVLNDRFQKNASL